jgi:hypothetical protein
MYLTLIRQKILQFIDDAKIEAVLESIVNGFLDNNGSRGNAKSYSQSGLGVRLGASMATPFRTGISGIPLCRN